MTQLEHTRTRAGQIWGLSLLALLLLLSACGGATPTTLKSTIPTTGRSIVTTKVKSRPPTTSTTAIPTARFARLPLDSFPPGWVVGAQGNRLRAGMTHLPGGRLLYYVTWHPLGNGAAVVGQMAFTFPTDAAAEIALGNIAPSFEISGLRMQAISFPHISGAAIRAFGQHLAGSLTIYYAAAAAGDTVTVFTSGLPSTGLDSLISMVAVSAALGANPNSVEQVSGLSGAADINSSGASGP